MKGLEIKMMIFVTGGSGSGKSAYAERRMEDLSVGIKKYYLAAMQCYDEESKKKAERHRKMRDGRGYDTIEQFVNIESAVTKMEEGERTALLECVLNLTANEMFLRNEKKTAEDTAEKIVRGILELKEALVHIAVVSGNIFEDGIVYDEATMEYMRAVSQINRELADRADEAVEIVAGIPLTLKEQICIY